MSPETETPRPDGVRDEAKFPKVQGNDAIPTGFEQAGMISGLGKFYSNKNGDKPYLRVILADVRKMVDNPPSVDKDQAQWLIPSTLDARVHAEQEACGEFWMLWADVDWKALAPKPMSDVASVVRGLIGADVEIYASRSATVDRQKCRVLIPLNEPLCGADWIMSQRVLNLLLAESGIEPDCASEGAGQLLYLPNRGEWYHTSASGKASISRLYRPGLTALRVCAGRMPRTRLRSWPQGMPPKSAGRPCGRRMSGAGCKVSSAPSTPPTLSRIFWFRPAMTSAARDFAIQNPNPATSLHRSRMVAFIPCRPLTGFIPGAGAVGLMMRFQPTRCCSIKATWGRPCGMRATSG